MCHLLNFLILTISIDQQTVLQWFGVENSNNYNGSEALSLGTLNLIVNELWQKLQTGGLALSDIEYLGVLIFLLRFLFLAIQYNLKTSFIISFAGFFAACMWYRQFYDIVMMYKTILVRIPFYQRLGYDAMQEYIMMQQEILTNEKLKGLTTNGYYEWTHFGKVLGYAFRLGIMNKDRTHYIDPISMLIANFPFAVQKFLAPIYYALYNNLIPNFYEAIKMYFRETAGIATYVVITRMGKRYCPYVIRWHWTFAVMSGLFNTSISFIMTRIWYYQLFTLKPELDNLNNIVKKLFRAGEMVPNDYLIRLSELRFENMIANTVTASFPLVHVTFVLLAMLHAIFGQYFYLPFFTENNEMHIGERPKNSRYSLGKTAWQNENKWIIEGRVPKLWYGWLGRGTKKKNVILKIIEKIKKFIKKRLKKFRRRF